MAYGPAYGQPGVTTTTGRSGLSKWWPISFFLITLVLFIVGGGLIGAWVSSAQNSIVDSYNSDYDSYYTTYSANNGLYYGALACFALGGICKLTAWILLIVYCVQRRNSRTIVVTQAYEPYHGQQQWGNNGGYPAPAGQHPGYAPAPVPQYGNGYVAPDQNGKPGGY